MDRRLEYFKCQRCGTCCSDIELPYDPKSILKIAEYLDITPEETFLKYYGRKSEDGQGWVFEEHKRKPCPFLTTDNDGKKSCRIHIVKPDGCRLYPFGSTGTLDCPETRNVIEKIREEDAKL